MKLLISILFLLLAILSCTKYEEFPNDEQWNQTSNHRELNQETSKSKWIQVTNFNSTTYLRCIGTNGQDIYAGTDENLYKSENNGLNG